MKINLLTQTEAILTLQELPNLIYLNGKSTKEDFIIDIDEADIEKFSLNGEIENFNLIFSKINEKLKSVSKDKQKLFFQDFQTLLKSEISGINSNIDNSVPNYIYASNVLKVIKIFHCLVKNQNIQLFQ